MGNNESTQLNEQELNEATEQLINSTEALASVLSSLNNSTALIQEVIDKKIKNRVDAETQIMLTSEPEVTVDSRSFGELDVNVMVLPDFNKLHLLKDVADTTSISKPMPTVMVNYFLNDLREVLELMFDTIGDSVIDNGYYIILDRVATEIYLIMMKENRTDRYAWCKVRVPYAKENTYLTGYHERMKSVENPIKGDFSGDTIFFACDTDTTTKWKRELFRVCSHDIINSSVLYLNKYLEDK